MLHAGFAAELAATFTHDRMLSIPPDERSARASDRARSARAFEQALSLGGATSLLALAVLGPAAALIGVAAIVFVIAARVFSRSAVRVSDRTRPVPPTRDPADRRDRWRSWRVAEPDPEYLRRRAA